MMAKYTFQTSLKTNFLIFYIKKCFGLIFSGRFLKVNSNGPGFTATPTTYKTKVTAKQSLRIFP